MHSRQFKFGWDHFLYVGSRNNLYLILQTNLSKPILYRIDCHLGQQRVKLPNAKGP